MKPAQAHRRPALAAGIVASIAVVLAGCGAASSSGPAASAGSTGPTAAASAMPSATPLATRKPHDGTRAGFAAVLPSLIACMKAQDMPLTSASTDKQVRQAFRALPLAGQERVFKACEHVLPASARRVVAQDLAKEKGMKN